MSTLFKMIACDYDGTLVTQGVMSPNTEQALLQAQQQGYFLCLITGREFDDILSVCLQIELFDLVVAENGAIIYLPATQEIEYLAAPPPPQLIAQLKHKAIPFSQGRVIFSVTRQYQQEVDLLIRALQLPLQIIFNKDAAMILPIGVDKATGLQVGIKRYDISLPQVVGVGDAENDIAFMQLCGLKVAVANALDAVKANADLVLNKPNGDGIVELVEVVIGD